MAYENPEFTGEQYILDKGLYPSIEAWGGKNCKISSVQPIVMVRSQFCASFASFFEVFLGSLFLLNPVYILSYTFFKQGLIINFSMFVNLAVLNFFFLFCSPNLCRILVEVKGVKSR